MPTPSKPSAAPIQASLRVVPDNIALKAQEMWKQLQQQAAPGSDYANAPAITRDVERRTIRRFYSKIDLRSQPKFQRRGAQPAPKNQLSMPAEILLGGTA